MGLFYFMRICYQRGDERVNLILHNYLLLRTIRVIFNPLAPLNVICIICDRFMILLQLFIVLPPSCSFIYAPVLSTIVSTSLGPLILVANIELLHAIDDNFDKPRLMYQWLRAAQDSFSRRILHTAPRILVY